MTPARVRSSLSLALVLICLTGLSAAAEGKRRAVTHPGPAGDLITAGVIKGVVLDDTTGAPIASVRITAGTKQDVTGADGKFESKNVTGFGFILVEATRSGYLTKTEKITTSGDRQLTLRMTPTPTVHVRKTDNTTLDVDFESLEFGYAVPFSGYRQAQYEDFCKNGATVQIDRSEIRKINGPASVVHGAASCCPDKDVLRVNLQLKSGETTDVYFIDSCEAGVTRIDLIARDHLKGQFQFVPFTEISEVVFP
jgi:hypothetical protein